jgi:hypothetical protein
MAFRLISFNNVAHTRALMVQLKMAAETGARRSLKWFSDNSQQRKNDSTHLNSESLILKYVVI